MSELYRDLGTRVTCDGSRAGPLEPPGQLVSALSVELLWVRPLGGLGLRLSERSCVGGPLTVMRVTV